MKLLSNVCVDNWFRARNENERESSCHEDSNVDVVGRSVVAIDFNPSHGFWTTRLMKVFRHEGQCTCIYNTHGWIVYIMLFPVVCGTPRGSSRLGINEFLKMTK